MHRSEAKYDLSSLLQNQGVESEATEDTIHSSSSEDSIESSAELQFKFDDSDSSSEEDITGNNSADINTPILTPPTSLTFTPSSKYETQSSPIKIPTPLFMHSHKKMRALKKIAKREDSIRQLNNREPGVSRGGVNIPGKSKYLTGSGVFGNKYKTGNDEIVDEPTLQFRFDE